MSKISFIKSDDRKYNIERSLSLIKSEIINGLKNAENIVVKPNCVVDNVKLAATNAEALDAVFEFIQPYAKNQIILAEGTGTGDTITAFKNYKYLNLQTKYDFAIVDLNNDDYETIELFDRRGKLWKAQIAKTITKSDYLISVGPPKTHNEVVYTGAIKNVAVGSLLRQNNIFPRLASKIGFKKNNKTAIHQGYKMINKNIAKIANKIRPHLSIIDGYEAMQADGPISGEMVPAHFAISSSDPIAADWLACNLMGIDIKNVGYLSLLGAGEGEHFVIGDDWQNNVINFKMHSNFEKMKNWK